MKGIRLRSPWVLLVVLLCSGQVVRSEEFVHFSDNPLAPPDTRSPRTALYGFIQDINTVYEYVQVSRFAAG